VEFEQESVSLRGLLESIRNIDDVTNTTEALDAAEDRFAEAYEFTDSEDT
jgi:hypothetical protein